MKTLIVPALLFSLATFTTACGGDSDADALGVGAQCVMADECDTENGQTCLTAFKGGYCGIQGCTSDAECVEDSACITHTDSMNYCFRVCADKAECNANRDAENESNCSSNVTFVDTAMNRKACVPPSAGT